MRKKKCCIKIVRVLLTLGLCLKIVQPQISELYGGYDRLFAKKQSKSVLVYFKLCLKKKKKASSVVCTSQRFGNTRTATKRESDPNHSWHYIYKVSITAYSPWRPPPAASKSVSHLFSVTAISHGLDTRVFTSKESL